MRPLMIDGFCGGGGAARGYHEAGFQVVGVDKEPQPNYPYEFVQADLFNPRTKELELPPSLARRAHLFKASHWSPPCQSYSDLAKRNGNGHMWPRLIGPARRLAERLGVPYVIENVEGAESEMADPITLCGTMFAGLRVLRHRLFEVNFPISQPEHPEHPLVFTHDKRKAHYGRLNQNTSYVQVTGGGNCTIANARAAMGIGWMTKPELNEAIPPAYTRFVGAFLLEELR
jgi:DNA (cytosine-5)-methyltransferase 1